ncbi:hypothetical protein AB1Y20_010891 [Prymnesium parvum]|uniref:SET domain-containing protein n=1 Tax=Prymnesium parvum TaxID=97485 RepID=A0AB34IQ24_PRYPA
MAKASAAGLPPDWEVQGLPSLLYKLNTWPRTIPADQAKHLLSRLSLPPAALEQCFTYSHQVVPKMGMTKPVVNVIPPQTASDGVLTYDLADVLLSIFALLFNDDDSTTQAVQGLLASIVKLGETSRAPLLIPTLRTEEVFLHCVIELCYHWATAGQQPLMALSVLAGFATACTSADIPAARQACTMIRSRFHFPMLLQASLLQAREPNAALVLGRFWDAVLGTPVQNPSEAAALSNALGELVHSPELESSISLLLTGLQSRASEQLTASRYGGCAPLLRITSSLLQSGVLVNALIQRGLGATLLELTDCVMLLVTTSMTGDYCDCLQDLLAAMALEVVSVAVSQDRLGAIFEAPTEELEASRSPKSALRKPLEQLLVAAVHRQSLDCKSPILPRLPESLRRFYHVLQKCAGRSLMEVLLIAGGQIPDWAASVNHHLGTLSKASDIRGRVRSTGGGTFRLGVDMLPRFPANPSTAHSRNAYPILPPAQPFVDIYENRIIQVDEVQPHVFDLELAPDWIARALFENRTAKLALGEEGRQLLVVEPVAKEQLVCEFCGEVLVDDHDFVGQLATYSAIWPPQLCMLRIGSSKLALDISRVASPARFAEHSNQPSCELRGYQFNGKARLFIISTQALQVGDPVTVNYTISSIGGKHSHEQADWILAIREARRFNLPESKVSSRPVAIPPPTRKRMASDQLLHGLSARSVSRVDDAHLIKALKTLKAMPVDFLAAPANVPLDAEGGDAAKKPRSNDVEAERRDVAATMMGMVNVNGAEAEGAAPTPSDDAAEAGAAAVEEAAEEKQGGGSPAAHEAANPAASAAEEAAEEAAVCGAAEEAKEKPSPAHERLADETHAAAGRSHDDSVAAARGSLAAALADVYQRAAASRTHASAWGGLRPADPLSSLKARPPLGTPAPASSPLAHPQPNCPAEAGGLGGALSRAGAFTSQRPSVVPEMHTLHQMAQLQQYQQLAQQQLLKGRAGRPIAQTQQQMHVRMALQAQHLASEHQKSKARAPFAARSMAPTQPPYMQRHDTSPLHQSVAAKGPPAHEMMLPPGAAQSSAQQLHALQSGQLAAASPYLLTRTYPQQLPMATGVQLTGHAQPLCPGKGGRGDSTWSISGLKDPPRHRGPKTKLVPNVKRVSHVYICQMIRNSQKMGNKGKHPSSIADTK